YHCNSREHLKRCSIRNQRNHCKRNPDKQNRTYIFYSSLHTISKIAYKKIIYEKHFYCINKQLPCQFHNRTLLIYSIYFFSVSCCLLRLIGMTWPFCRCSIPLPINATWRQFTKNP